MSSQEQLHPFYDLVLKVTCDRKSLLSYTVVQSSHKFAQIQGAEAETQNPEGSSIKELCG